MYIRFVVARKDEESGRRLGVFHAMADLQESLDITSEERNQLDAVGKWFRDQLPSPARLSVSAKPNRKPQAISWFKTSATEHIERIRSVEHILRAHGIFVETLTTMRPGKIVYEDEHQVAAHPFSDTPI